MNQRLFKTTLFVFVALASGVVPHIVARVASASDDDGSVSKRQPDSRMLKKGAK